MTCDGWHRLSKQPFKVMRDKVATLRNGRLMLLRAAALLILSAGMAQAQQIDAAMLQDPTDRYPHRVLGPIPEHTTLLVVLTDGRDLAVRHAPGMVFEDIAPRLVDVTGDGMREVLVVESHDLQGARLAIYGMNDGNLVLRAATPFIGQRFRWIGVSGAADLSGDGAIEIALVDRPHLARVLRVWRVDADGPELALTQIASLSGLSNHRIGDPYISGGIRNCGERPEIILANTDWSRIVGITLEAGQLVRRDLAPLTGADAFDAVMACAD